MLVIRYQRQGRKNSAFFRIVLTESSKPTKSGFLKILGWYNPHTKESSLKKEEILDWLNKGAQASNSVSKLLEMNKIDHKNASFVPDAPKAKKEKEVKSKAPVAPPKDSQEAEKQPASEQTGETDESKEVEIQQETVAADKQEEVAEVPAKKGEEVAPTSKTVGVPTGNVGKEKVEKNLEEGK
ncbi:MAG: 30S ribosomal protein S16 [bacterium]